MNVTIFHLANPRDCWFLGDRQCGDRAPQYEEVVSFEYDPTTGGDYQTAEEVWLLFENGAPGERHPLKEQRRIRSFMVGDVIRLDDSYYRVASVGFTKLENLQASRVRVTAALHDERIEEARWDEPTWANEPIDFGG